MNMWTGAPWNVFIFMLYIMTQKQSVDRRRPVGGFPRDAGARRPEDCNVPHSAPGFFSGTLSYFVVSAFGSKSNQDKKWLRFSQWVA